MRYDSDVSSDGGFIFLSGDTNSIDIFSHKYSVPVGILWPRIADNGLDWFVTGQVHANSGGLVVITERGAYDYPEIKAFGVSPTFPFFKNGSRYVWVVHPDQRMYEYKLDERSIPSLTGASQTLGFSDGIAGFTRDKMNFYSPAMKSFGPRSMHQSSFVGMLGDKELHIGQDSYTDRIIICAQDGSYAGIVFNSMAYWPHAILKGSLLHACAAGKDFREIMVLPPHNEFAGRPVIVHSDIHQDVHHDVPHHQDVPHSDVHTDIHQDVKPVPQRKQVGFGPNIGSRDFQQCFTEKNKWQSGWDQISSMHFYWHNIVDISGDSRAQEMVGPNTYENLVAAGAFKSCSEAGILQEVEIGGPAQQAIEAADRIEAAGGELGAILWDKVLLEISPEQFFDYYKHIRDEFTKMVIVPYCAILPKNAINDAIAFGVQVWRPELFGAERVYEHIVRWDDLGCRPDALRIDAGGNLSRSDFNIIREACDDRSIPLHMTIVGQDGLSDEAYIDYCVKLFHESMKLGKWDAVMVQSWATTAPHSKGDFTVPHNLPNIDPHSHTWLLDYILERR